MRIIRRACSVILACASSARNLIGRSRVPVRRLGALGGVLGDVRSYGALGQLLTVVEVGGADRADVELAAEDEGMCTVVDLSSD